MPFWEAALRRLTPEQRAWLEGQRSWWRGAWVGLVYYEWTLSHRRERAQLDNLFLLLTFGDLVGVPIPPSPLALRLLPYLMHELGWWKKRMVRGHEFSGLLD